MDLKARIENAKARASIFLLSMQIKDGIFDTSSHNKGKIEGMTLPATYNAVSALGLMNSLDLIDKEKAKSFLLKHKKRNGVYRIPEMKRSELTYPSFEYDDLHITNYSISALGYLGYNFSSSDLNFIKKYNIKRLDKWLSRRDMAAPWMEGNYVVNLASFLILAEELGINGFKELNKQMINWHYDNQDEYGYYHDTEINDLTNAFAGATHNYHIFYYYNLPIARYREVIDYLLTRPTTVESACLDVDEVDVLCNFIKYNYRVEEIKKWLTQKLISLLDFQNEDGGFSDEITGTRVFDGWKKYTEPQGISNCFATWFRMIAIGMISFTLYNDIKGFTFRNTIGIGYFNKDYLKDGFDEKSIKEQEEIILKRSAEKRKAFVSTQDEKFDNSKIEDLIELFSGKFAKVDKNKLNFSAIFSITIVDEGAFNIAIEGKSITISKGTNNNANLHVSVNRKTLMKIVSGKLDARLAYGLGKLKCKGNIAYALKLSILL